MQETHDYSPPRPMLEPGLVLIVDDEGPIAQTLATIVEDAGYTPLIAYNGEQALKLVQQRWPQVVLTDLMMPVITGTQLITALRAQAEFWQLPRPSIVLLTAAGPRYGINSEADAFLSKPFALQDVDEILHRFFQPQQ